MAMAASALVSSPRLLVFPPSGKAVISKRNSLCPSCGLPGLRCFAARRLGRYASLPVAASMPPCAKLQISNPTVLLFQLFWPLLLGELERKVEKGKTVIPDPDYRIPLVLLGIAGGFLYQDNLLPAATIGLLGLLLLFQTTRVRFVFDEEALEVRVGEKLEDSGENVFVGGKNRWKYSTFVNWELWWPKFPVLVYFKETQTKPEGQIHFFPVIFNGKQLYDVMVERAGPSNTSMPKY